ncbi:MAG: YgjV family protein [Clostridia bacterium]|nr:YgjV family protein [Clostridia bacterium]
MFIDFFREMLANFSKPTYLVGQTLGFILVIESFFIFLQKDRSKLLILKLVFDVATIFQLSLTGIALGTMTWITGALINLIGVGRETVCYFRGKKQWASRSGWLFLFGALFFLSPFATPAIDALVSGESGTLFDSVAAGYAEFFSTPKNWLVSFIPAAGSALAVYGYYCMRTDATRIVVGVGTAMWFVYALLIRNPMSVVSNFVALVSIGIGVIGDILAAKRAQAARKVADSESAEEKL